MGVTHYILVCEAEKMAINLKTIRKLTTAFNDAMTISERGNLILKNYSWITHY